MEKAKEKSIHHTAEKISYDIKNMKTYHDFYSGLQKLVSSSYVEKVDFKRSLLSALKQSGKETDLKNSVYHWVRQCSNCDGINGYPNKEPLAYLRKSQLGWEKRIHKSLNTMCGELGVPLARVRLNSDRNDFVEKWSELSQYDIDLSFVKPVYAPKDFLEVLLLIRSPNFRNFDNWLGFSLSHVSGSCQICRSTRQRAKEHAFRNLLIVINDVFTVSANHDAGMRIRRPLVGRGSPIRDESIPEVAVRRLYGTDLERTFYGEISRGEPLLGVHPHMASLDPRFPTLEAELTFLGEKVLTANHAPLGQEFLKHGCPRALRSRIWALVLGSETKPSKIEYFQNLKQLVFQYDLMVDKLIMKDIRLTASNDDQFFVFEDTLYEVMLSFSRDTEVLSVFNHSSANPLHAVLKNRSALLEHTVVFPPCGVIPFHGFTMYAAPLCYLYDDPVQLYHTFRSFYTRYFFRLHEVSSDKQGLLCLCLLYGRLLKKFEPELWLHFHRIKVQPIRLVFKWIMRAFGGLLPQEQLLLLWDIILAYDSLEVLSILATAIVSFRKENLMIVGTQQEMESVLADLSSIAVMPLIQFVLLRD